MVDRPGAFLNGTKSIKQDEISIIYMNNEHRVDIVYTGFCK